MGARARLSPWRPMDWSKSRPKFNYINIFYRFSAYSVAAERVFMCRQTTLAHCPWRDRAGAHRISLCTAPLRPRSPWPCLWCAAESSCLNNIQFNLAAANNPQLWRASARQLWPLQWGASIVGRGPASLPVARLGLVDGCRANEPVGGRHNGRTSTSTNTNTTNNNNNNKCSLEPPKHEVTGAIVALECANLLVVMRVIPSQANGRRH